MFYAVGGFIIGVLLTGIAMVVMLARSSDRTLERLAATKGITRGHSLLRLAVSVLALLSLVVIGREVFLLTFVRLDSLEELSFILWQDALTGLAFAWSLALCWIAFDWRETVPARAIVWAGAAGASLGLVLAAIHRSH